MRTIIDYAENNLIWLVAIMAVIAMLGIIIGIMGPQFLFGTLSFATMIGFAIICYRLVYINKDHK